MPMVLPLRQKDGEMAIAGVRDGQEDVSFQYTPFNMHSTLRRLLPFMEMRVPPADNAINIEEASYNPLVE